MNAIPTDKSAFQECIGAFLTTRLWDAAVEAAKTLPLLEPRTAKKKRYRAFWERQEYDTATITPQMWYVHEFTIGRQNRNLVLRFNRIFWQFADNRRDTLGSEWQYESWDVYEPYHAKNERPKPVPKTFLLGLPIFPLTIQQAAWVGAKDLVSDSKYRIWWGTAEDVEQLKREFPFPLTASAVLITSED